jgi:hypothetical protein
MFAEITKKIYELTKTITGITFYNDFAPESTLNPICVYNQNNDLPNYTKDYFQYITVNCDFQISSNLKKDVIIFSDIILNKFINYRDESIENIRYLGSDGEQIDINNMIYIRKLSFQFRIKID